MLTIQAGPGSFEGLLFPPLPEYVLKTNCCMLHCTAVVSAECFNLVLCDRGAGHLAVHLVPSLTTFLFLIV